MNVADLLQLERALETDGIVNASSDEEDILGIGVLCGKPLNSLLILKDGLDLLRNALQLPDQLPVLLLRYGIPHPAQLQRQSISRNELCAVGLGGGHGDFRPGQRIEDMVRFPGDGGAHHIHNAQSLQASLLCLPQGRQRIRRLSGLTDDDHQPRRIQNGIPVPELRCQLHPHRDSCQPLQHILHHHTHMVGTAAGHHIDLRNAPQRFLVQSHSIQVNAIFLQNRMQRISHGLRLLVNFLHHEMLIAALFCCLGIHLNLHQLLLNRLLINVEKFHFSAGELRDLEISDIVHLPCIFKNCRHIRSQIAVRTGNAENHGAVLPGRINGFRIIHEQHCKGIGAANPHHCP